MAANLRRLRIARHLSLSELARGTGIGKATLSSIENQRANPTVETLTGLARAAGSAHRAARGPAAAGDAGGPAEPEPARVARRSPAACPGCACRPAGGTAQLYEIALPARHVHEAGPRSPGARLGVYMLQGKLITGPVERSTELGAGDYASFPADMAFVYEARGAPARALVIATQRSG